MSVSGYPVLVLHSEIRTSPLIKALSGVPKVALVYKTTSVMRTPLLTCPNDVHNREVPLYSRTCT